MDRFIAGDRTPGSPSGILLHNLLGFNAHDGRRIAGLFVGVEDLLVGSINFRSTGQGVKPSLVLSNVDCITKT
jgi:hypothetical protein